MAAAREIYTKAIEDMRDREFTVCNKKTVVTGEYIHGSKGGYYDEECEPPYLANSKSHVILYLGNRSVDHHSYYPNNVFIDGVTLNLSIEKCNVEKVVESKEACMDGR